MAGGKTLIPEDFAITDSMRFWASRKVPGFDIDNETENFCDWWRGHGRKMLDWTATWRVWMRRAAKEVAPSQRLHQAPRAPAFVSQPAVVRTGNGPVKVMGPPANLNDNSPRFKDWN